MPTATATPAELLSGPGKAWKTSLGTALPASAVGASKFDATDFATWDFVGTTDAGHTFHDSVDTDWIRVAEQIYGIKRVTTGADAHWEMVLTNIKKATLSLALNGPAVTTSGTGATLKTELTRPTPGTEVRSMFAWQSEDDTVRFIAEQVFNVGELSIDFKPGTDKAMIPLDLSFEVPTSGVPYHLYLAGATRGA